MKIFLWLLAYRSLNTHEKLPKKFKYTMLSPSMCCLCFKEEETLDHLFMFFSLLRKLGTLCLEFLIWSFVFLVRLITGWLKGSTLEVIARKETSYEDVLLGPFCGAFGKKGTVEFFENNYNSFDSFRTVLQHTASWWSKNYTGHFCNYSLSMIFNYWKTIF